MATVDKEPERLAALRRYAILDSEPEAAYNDIARLASYVCDTPMALVSLVDEHRLWFKSRHGLSVEQMTREGSLCDRAILDDGVFTVPDALADARFEAHPLVTSDLGIRFYAGAPLIDAGGIDWGPSA